MFRNYKYLHEYDGVLNPSYIYSGIRLSDGDISLQVDFYPIIMC